MQLIIHINGQVSCLYSEAIDLAQLGELAIRRGSHVEPDQHGQWIADLAPCGGPVLGPYSKRSHALAAEQDWLNEHWLTGTRSSSHVEDEQIALAVIA